jgi:3-deoxy-D-manno-octulosonic acid kinase
VTPPTSADFEVVEAPSGSGSLLVLARQKRQAFLDSGLEDPDRLLERAEVEQWISGGRAPHPVIRAGEERWVVKSYRRGGWVARWNHDLYWSGRRFLRELEVCLHALGAGVPSVPPIALVMKRRRFGGLRAWLVTPFVAPSRTLAAWLRPAADDAAGADLSLPARVFRLAGEAVRRMHDAGIDHPDLNLTNLLVSLRPGAEGPAVLILDWDRARRRAHGGAFVHRNLLRLYRSALKLRPDLARLGFALRSFLHGYFSAPCPERRPGENGGAAPVKSGGRPADAKGPRPARRGLAGLKAFYRRHRLAEYFCHRLFRSRRAPESRAGRGGLRPAATDDLSP